LQDQLFEHLRTSIESGRLQPGARMPSTRALAEHFAVSRTTVVLTYERLVASGHLLTVPAGATYVSAQRGAPPAAVAFNPRAADRTGDVPAGSGPVALGARDRLEVAAPDATLFPSARWRTLVRVELSRVDVTRAPSDIAGSARLRTALAGWLRAHRGLDIAPAQIVLAGDRARALEIVAQLALVPGSKAIVESPGDLLAAKFYTSANARLVPVAVDRHGLITGLLPPQGGALVHVTPSGQDPLGVVMPAERRYELVDWAARTGTTIVEMDRVGDLSYGHGATSGLGSIAGPHEVIYIGHFEDVLAPVVTTSFLALPAHLVARALAAKRQLGQHVEWFAEAALATFIQTGGYLRHVRKLRKEYGDRRQALVRTLQAELGPLDLFGAGAGLAVAWEVPEHLGPARAIADIARRSGLAATIIPAQPGVSKELAGRCVLLGFGQTEPAQLCRAVEAFARALQPRGRRAHDYGDLQAVND
jgi:GntR family transcriptional regulator/MocR family aminotransferase